MSLQQASYTPSFGGLGLNGHQIENLGPITRGAEAKLLFHRTPNGNIVDELRAHKREVVSTDETAIDGLVIAGTIEKVDAERGVLVLLTERQTLLQLKVNHDSQLLLNGHVIENLDPITRGAEAKLPFHRTPNGNIVDELHAHKREVVSTLQERTAELKDAVDESTDAQDQLTDTAEESTGVQDTPADTAEESTGAQDTPADTVEESTSAQDTPADTVEESTSAQEQPAEQTSDISQ